MLKGYVMTNDFDYKSELVNNGFDFPLDYWLDTYIDKFADRYFCNVLEKNILISSNNQMKILVKTDMNKDVIFTIKERHVDGKYDEYNL